MWMDVEGEKRKDYFLESDSSSRIRVDIAPLVVFLSVEFFYEFLSSYLHLSKNK